MDTKAAFEKWFDDEFGKSTTPEEIVVRDMVRQGWASSRAAIEIEFPERARLENHGKYKGRYLCGDCSFDAEYALGINHTIDWFKEAVILHGIRIKGKTE